MNYNNGMNFGYDQIFVNPIETLDRFGAGSVKRNAVEEDLIRKIQKLETKKDSGDVQNAAVHFGSAGGAGSVYALNQDAEKEALRRAFADLQRKNDMLIMFIVFLVVFVMLNNTQNYGSMHYGPHFGSVPGTQILGAQTQ